MRGSVFLVISRLSDAVVVALLSKESESWKWSPRGSWAPMMELRSQIMKIRKASKLGLMNISSCKRDQSTFFGGDRTKNSRHYSISNWQLFEVTWSEAMIADVNTIMRIIKFSLGTWGPPQRSVMEWITRLLYSDAAVTLEFKRYFAKSLSHLLLSVSFRTLHSLVGENIFYI